MKRLTYKTVGDAFRQPHYCHGPGIKKDDLLQRLGQLEDFAEAVDRVIHEGKALVNLHCLATDCDLDRIVGAFIAMEDKCNG